MILGNAKYWPIYCAPQIKSRPNIRAASLDIFRSHTNEIADSASHINIPRLQRIQLNERPPRLDVIAHQRRENLIRCNRVFDLHFQ